MRVYIAGPISKGPLERNIRRAFDAATILMEFGFQPYVPHFCCFLDITHPQDYERWMELGCSFLEVCEAVFRVRGESAGADRECAVATERGIPIFHSIEDLIRYRDKDKEVRELAADIQRMESAQIRGS